MTGTCTGTITVAPPPNVTAPVLSVTPTYVKSYTDGAGTLWDAVDLGIVTGAGSGAQPTISLSVDGVVYLQITRQINSSFVYRIGVSGRPRGSSYNICLDSTCTTYVSKTAYAAIDGSTPAGTIACLPIYGYTTVVIVGWYPSLGKYRTHTPGTSDGADLYNLPGNILIGAC